MKRPKAPHGSTVEQRLAFFSIPEPNSGCLLWLGKLRRGYPTMTIDGATRTVHRVALERKLGRPLLPHEFACHKCDVKICIAEDHLFLGDHADNMADMKAKGRAAAGLHGTPTKLTPDQVHAIRADSRSERVIARAYGVAYSIVGGIKRGTRWAHLPAISSN